MGYVINHSKLARVVKVEGRVNKAKYITEAIDPEAWKGKKAIIIGGGPSLEDFDSSHVAFCDFVIGINKSFTRYQSNINYCMDYTLHDALSYPQKADPKNAVLRQKWSEFSGIKLFLRMDSNAKFSPGVFIINHIPNKVVSHDISIGIYGGGNSGFGALMLAIALGFNRIGLLGFDMKVDTEKKRTHWHDGYWHQRCHEIDVELELMQGKLDKFRMEFEEFSDSILQNGVKVYNLCKSSALECFPKIGMNEFLRL